MKTKKQNTPKAARREPADTAQENDDAKIEPSGLFLAPDGVVVNGNGQPVGFMRMPTCEEYPFQTPGNYILNIGILGRPLWEDEIKLLEQAGGSPPTKATLKAFLRLECGVQEPKDLSLDEILALLSHNAGKRQRSPDPEESNPSCDLQNPTRPVALKHAAKDWFEIDPRTLKNMIAEGSIKARRLSKRRWEFELDEVTERKPSARADADPCEYRSRQPD